MRVAITVYLMLAGCCALIAVAVGLRRWAGRGTPGSRQPDAIEVALIEGGDARAVQATAALLFAAGAVAIGPRGGLVLAGPPPADAGALTVAVHDAIRRDRPIEIAAFEPDVAAALRRVEQGMRATGWILNGGQRFVARLAGLPVLLAAVLVATLVPLVPAGTDARSRVDQWGLYGLLGVAALAAAAAGVLLISAVPRATRAAQTDVAFLRSAMRHLHPEAEPDWAALGPGDAALAVALFGRHAFWASAPALASALGIRRPSELEDDGE